MTTTAAEERELEKAYQRLWSFESRASDPGKLINMIDLRTRKMTKTNKLHVWYEVLKDNKYRDSACLALARYCELS